MTEASSHCRGEEEDPQKSSQRFIVVPHRQAGTNMLSPSCIGPFTYELSEDSNHESTSSEHESDADAVDDNTTMKIRLSFKAEDIDAVAEACPSNTAEECIKVEAEDITAETGPSTLEEAILIIEAKDQEILDLKNQLAEVRDWKETEMEMQRLAAKCSAVRQQIMRDQLKKVAASAADDSFLHEITLTLERR